MNWKLEEVKGLSGRYYISDNKGRYVYIDNKNWAQLHATKKTWFIKI